MSGPSSCGILWLVVILLAASGCRPARVFYFQPKRNDLSFYVDAATAVQYPDLDQPSLDEVREARPPITLSDPAFDRYWDLRLQEAISIALQNSKVLRTLGAVIQPQAPLFRAETSSSVYDTAVVESDPQLGVEGALAAFDVQLSTSIFWEKRDRPQNFGFFNPFVEQDVAQFNFQLGKKAATGTQLFFRNVTDYDNNNNPFQSVPSAYTTAFEIEARQPLLRGAGAQINRIPIVLARINTDISLAEFEARVRDLVLDVENAYWDLYCAYRTFEAAKTGRDRGLDTWRRINKRLRGGQEPPENEPLVRERYLSFRLALESAIGNLHDRENNLRWLMGLAATDGRMIRPIDEPTAAPVHFDWSQIRAESLVRTPELRRQKWIIQQRQLELIAARNNLLPQLDVVGLYRWLGVGDELIAASANGIRFPRPGSRAFEELTTGNFQETRFGVELAWPVGYRRELASVRSAELALAREKARLEDLELNVSHLLTLAVRQMDNNFQFAQTHLNRKIAAESEEERRDKLLIRRSDLAFLQALLDAQRRAAQSQADYYRALCDYNKAIALVHYRKGSLLQYNNVRLAEGPWPEKAYEDARRRAQRRNASFYLNYGWTRPPEVSRGPHAAPVHPPAEPNRPAPEALPAPAGLPSDSSLPGQTLSPSADRLPLRRLPPPAELLPPQRAAGADLDWPPVPLQPPPVRPAAFEADAGPKLDGLSRPHPPRPAQQDRLDDDAPQPDPHSASGWPANRPPPHRPEPSLSVQPTTARSPAGLPQKIRGLTAPARRDAAIRKAPRRPPAAEQDRADRPRANSSRSSAVALAQQTPELPDRARPSSRKRPGGASSATTADPIWLLLIFAAAIAAAVLAIDRGRALPGGPRPDDRNRRSRCWQLVSRPAAGRQTDSPRRGWSKNAGARPGPARRFSAAGE